MPTPTATGQTSLADKLTVEAKTLAEPKVEKTAVESERTVEADLGRVRYLATLIGQADEVVLRWFILVVALLLDPAACAWPAVVPRPQGGALRLPQVLPPARRESAGIKQPPPFRCAPSPSFRMRIN